MKVFGYLVLLIYYATIVKVFHTWKGILLQRHKNPTTFLSKGQFVSLHAHCLLCISQTINLNVFRPFTVYIHFWYLCLTGWFVIASKWKYVLYGRNYESFLVLEIAYIVCTITYCSRLLTKSLEQSPSLYSTLWWYN